jgi:hypothetical protein
MFIVIPVNIIKLYINNVIKLWHTYVFNATGILPNTEKDITLLNFHVIKFSIYEFKDQGVKYLLEKRITLHSYIHLLAFLKSFVKRKKNFNLKPDVALLFISSMCLKCVTFLWSII